MPAPFYTSNDSEISRLEGLYIKERNPPAQVSGAFLGVVSIVGECVRGPVDTAVEITSEARFKEVFGGRDYGSGGTLIGKVWLSMLNKPFGKVVVVRAAASAAVAASSTFANVTPTDIIRVDATSVGVWGGNVTIDIQNATDGNANHFNLIATYLGNTYTYRNLNTYTSSDDNLASTLGSDLANVIKITKLNNGRPLNAAAQVLGTNGSAHTAGSNGSIADTDFTASSRALDKIEYYPGIGAIMLGERSNATVNANMLLRAARSSDRLFLIGTTDETTSVSSAATDAASYRNQRVIYCFNHAYTSDPEAAADVLTFPTGWMASILSQTDVDIDPGEEDTKKYTAGITRLYNEGIGREDYITLRQAGITALEKQDGFDFVSGVLNDLTPGKERITRRRSADYMQLSIGSFLKHSVKKKNTSTQRMANAGALTAFLNDLKRAERIVQDFDVDTDKLNTDANRALGIEKILLRVKLIGHMLSLVLETEIGTGVTITQLQ